MKGPYGKGQKGWRGFGVFIGLAVSLLGLLAPISHVQAQQEVTLSGRVTDQAGQPVQGTFVFFQKMPGFVFVK